MIKSRTIYWGWFVVLAAFVILAVNYGSRYCFGIFVKPLTETFGWSRSETALASSIMIFAYGAGGIFTGRLLDRLQPRWIILAGTVIAAIGLILAARTQTPWQLYLSYGLLFGAGSSCFGVVVCVSSVGKWFTRRRGIAIGISTVGIGAGIMVLTPVLGYLLQQAGWQMGFEVMAATIVLLGGVFAALLMGKTSPEAYGLAPDGDPAPLTTPSACGPIPAQPSASSSFFLGDVRFQVLAWSYGIAVMVEMMAMVHQVPYAIDRNIDAVTAASCLGLVGVASVGGRFFFGWLSDRIRDPKYAASLGLLLLGAGMPLLLTADSTPLFVLYALVFGFGYGSIAPMMPILLADRFGRHVLGTVYGLLTFIVAVSGSIGPLLGGFIYDRLGSYRWAWWIDFLLMLAVAVLILALKPRTRELPAR